MSDIIGIGEAVSIHVTRAHHNDIGITTIILIMIIVILLIILFKG